MVGEDAPEFMPDVGIMIGMAIGSRGLLRLMGEPMFECDSRRRLTEGDTARRLEAVAYGSYLSSTSAVMSTQQTKKKRY